MRVRSIEYCGKADVYNMEVEDTHDFVVNGGTVVHNCYDEWRYVCMENPINPRMNHTEDRTIHEYDPLDLFKTSNNTMRRYGY